MDVFQFPGQGSQHVGMGRALCEAFPIARSTFDQADEVLQDVNLTDLCFAGPEEELNDTFNTQPALLVASIAALRVIQERGDYDPAYVAGHSMGEFSALVAAGVLSFEDGLEVVRERGRLMKQAGERNPGGMAAIIALDRETVDEICTAARGQGDEYVGIANDNCPGQIVISGHVGPVEAAMAAAQEKGAKKVVRLPISISSHSPLMEEAAGEFRRLLDTVEFRAPGVPVVANATASPLTDPGEIRQAVGRQLTSPVHWTDSMRWMIGQGVTRFVEVGPGKVLTGLAKRIDRQVERLTTADVLGLQEEE